METKGSPISKMSSVIPIIDSYFTDGFYKILSRFAAGGTLW